MKKKNNPIDKINIKLTIFLTCTILVVCAVISCSVNLVTGIAYMKALNKPETTQSTVPVSNTTTPETTERSETTQKVETSVFSQADNPHETTFDTPSTTAAAKLENTAQKVTGKESNDTTAPEKSAEYKEEADGKYYVTASGKKYHISTCSYLGKSKIEISLTDIEDKGYSPCSRCIE